MRYAELHCKTNFSFLEGASHPAELVDEAARLGYHALAITDRNSLAGVVRAHGAAKDLQDGTTPLDKPAAAPEGKGSTGNIGLPVASRDPEFKLLIGAEITPEDGPPVVVLATGRPAYANLSRLITRGRRGAAKGQCRLSVADVAEFQEGLIACVVPPFPLPLGEGRSERPPLPLGEGRGEGRLPGGGDSSRRSAEENAVLGAASTVAPRNATQCVPYREALHAYRDIFADRGYLFCELVRGPSDEARLDRLAELARQTRLPLVAAGDVHYHVAARLRLQHVLTAIRHGVSIHEAGHDLFSNAQRHLRSLENIRRTYHRAPDAIRRTIQIADRCTFSLDELRYDYPRELAPDGQTPLEYLKRLTWDGARQRYGERIPEKVRGLLEHELALIEQLRYEAYFLTVCDLVRFARGRGILCQGRGSAANSAVCYCLGVTSIDPERMDVLFERFISRERNEAPDIDIDFEHERREEVLQYLYDKYGRERAGIAATVITYRTRSAIRDVGKALGLSLDRVDALAKSTDGHYVDEKLAGRCQMSGVDPTSKLGRDLIELVEEILGFPRHLSQHVGGMVMTESPLCELVPIENAAMPGRTVIQWDKDDLDELGMLKVDCLCLGMLTAIRKCFDLLMRHGGDMLESGVAFEPSPLGRGWSRCDRAREGEAEKESMGDPMLPVPPAEQRATLSRREREFLASPSLAGIPPDDPATYEMIRRADTIGVFQIESRAQMSMLPRLRPARWYDLVIEVAIVRPGPIQGGMVHPYLRRRAGEEPVAYPNEAIRQVLEKTLGVPLFQEQAMRLAMVAAGFTPGEADQLRRAMGAWRRTGVIERFRQKLVEGMKSHGLSDQFAESVYRQIRGFGEYGFPESHAASFALLVYASAWLKCHYPAAYTAAMLNSWPLGFYAPAQLIRDVREHGVTVLPVDINMSQWDCTLEANAAGDPLSPATPLASMLPAPAPGPHSLRLGWRMISGLARSVADGLLSARTTPYRSVHDVAERTGLSRAVLERLAKADVFASLRLSRRAALWQARAEEASRQDRPLLAGLAESEPAAALPAMSEQAEVFADYAAWGLSLRRHPIAFYREPLGRLGVVAARKLFEMQNNQPVRVGGLVLLRQRPSTAKGITFVTLEDETGVANLVIHQQTWERNYQIARRSSAWIADGHVERQGQVIHVIVRRLFDLADRLERLKITSRDFR